MIFNGIDNQTVEFKVTNYEFPENTTCQYDSNWLLIYLKVNSNFGKWQTIDPSLLTEEVKAIIEWFGNLSNNKKPDSNSLSFIEPNIEFELKDFNENSKIIRIIFGYESRPKNSNDEKEYYVDFEFNNEELKKISEDLKNELNAFPTRGFD
ncbi:hypothetical protein JM658_06695 [Joostella atrarenae]|uniref:Uncharacterized protein n=1 Tax=Joostella atrarenae TaxID=679257 RepID=A0ABS9J273_9FLAO|nr:hypothetical protein [Joostella atrarenae]MCF8714517.1 hypothetical protein [Joostella atrarenae]